MGQTLSSSQFWWIPAPTLIKSLPFWPTHFPYFFSLADFWGFPSDTLPLSAFPSLPFLLPLHLENDSPLLPTSFLFLFLLLFYILATLPFYVWLNILTVTKVLPKVCPGHRQEGMPERGHTLDMIVENEIRGKKGGKRVGQNVTQWPLEGSMWGFKLLNNPLPLLQANYLSLSTYHPTTDTLDFPPPTIFIKILQLIFLNSFLNNDSYVDNSRPLCLLNKRNFTLASLNICIDIYVIIINYAIFPLLHPLAVCLFCTHM